MYSFRFKLYATLLVTGLTILLFATKGADLISLYLTDTAGSGATEVALQYGLEYLGIMMVGLIPFAVNQSYATNKMCIRDSSSLVERSCAENVRG